jgi:hypothetical protein
MERARNLQAAGIASPAQIEVSGAGWETGHVRGPSFFSRKGLGCTKYLRYQGPFSDNSTKNVLFSREEFDD